MATESIWGGLGDKLTDYAKENGGVIARNLGSKLVDEVGARTGIALSNVGPDAAAGLTAQRGVGTPSPNTPPARNITQDAAGGWLGMLKSKWKWIAGGLAVAGAVWWFAKRKRRG